MSRPMLLFVAMAGMFGSPVAAADWAFAVYFGGAHTSPNTLRLEQANAGTQIFLRDVRYETRPLESPLYYGVRVSRYFGDVGIEGELIHLKAYARSDCNVMADGTIGGVPANGPVPFSAVIDRFSISHGLNYVLGNVVIRRPGARTTLEARGGIGVTVPHGESRVNGIYQEQYELGALAFQAAAGGQVMILRRLYAAVEYKVTTSAPSISVAGGTIAGRFTTQHVTAGLVVRP